MRKRKIAAGILAGVLSLLTLSACGKPNTDTSSGVGKNHQILCASQTQYALSNNQVVEIPIQKEIGDKNYLFMELTTDVNLVGYIYYENSQNSAQKNAEKIFIEKGAKEFTSFLDAFRVGAYGAFDKTITKLTLQNVDKGMGQVTLNAVGVSNRTYEADTALYIQDEHLKMGTALSMGGAIRHLEKLNANVVEYVDEAGNVRIEPNVDKTQVDVVTDEVNFVNIHDLGREIQQSYYSRVGEENGYAPTEEVLYDADLRYNPVQAGSAGDKQSQIIDFVQTESTLYVKTRPLEWFFDNRLSDSYMENTYLLDGSGVLRVSNRFVNFSQFTDMDKTQEDAQEMPAVYLVHPLNYFYCETREGTIFDPNLSPLPTSTQKQSLSQEVAGSYHYALRNDKLTNEWAAFVNENKFGVGIYMPKAFQYSASRGWRSTSYAFWANQQYSSYFHDLTGLKYVPSAYVNNYNYFSAVSLLKMADFIPLEYEYALYVGNVDEMRSIFQNYRDKQLIENFGINVWASY
ncbi:MAG: hypothetical protein IJX09_00015 [Clostridia bacterium]|nr:hypothetical protein [Clostridia bacterium]